MLKDKDIREPLFSFLEETYGRIRIIEEKNMGGSRADVIMVTPERFVGIEIKRVSPGRSRIMIVTSMQISSSSGLVMRFTWRSMCRRPGASLPSRR